MTFRPSTLVFAVVALLLILIPNHVHALQGVGPPPARRVNHLDMAAKLIKKRGPAPVAVVKRQATATDTPIIPAPTTAAPTTPAQPPTQPPPNNPIPSIITEIIGGGGDDVTTSTTSSRVRTTTTSASTSTSQSSSTTSSSSSSSGRTSSRPARTETAVETARPSPTTNSERDNQGFLPKSAVIGLIVAGASIVGVVAIWTIIRKWKFSPSRHFEDRLEPINWEPTANSGLPPPAAVARGDSLNSHRGRGSLGSDDQSHRNMTGFNDQPVSVAPDFPPPHDFTAGPAHYGAPGNGGYADLQRGPSPQVDYAGGGAPPNYGQFATPNPYDPYDYNAGYGQQRQY